jgi:CelD/BcsL family acetyltransferase involved in cellulose biosynthesis
VVRRFVSAEPAAGPGAAAPRAGAREASGLRVETISDLQGLLRIEGAWDRAVEEAGIDHPFLSHAWIRTWWECFGSGKTLQILAVKSGDDVVALAPLLREGARLYGVRVRQIGSLHNDHTPRCEAIVARRGEEVCQAIWDHLRDARDTWDVLSFRQVPVGPGALQALWRMAAADGFPTGIWRGEESPYVTLDRSFDAYLLGLSHNHRGQMRKRLRRLARLGPVELETLIAPDEAAAALPEGLRLESAGWKRGAGTAILCRPELQRFYTLLAGEAARAGQLRLLFLKVGAARVAFAYGLCFRDRLYVLKAGFDPAYAAYSPYQALCYLVLEKACALGLREYDFLGSSDDWKLHWTRTVRDHHWLYVFGDSLRARLLHAAKFVMAPRLRDWPPGRGHRDRVEARRPCTSPPGRV